MFDRLHLNAIWRQSFPPESCGRFGHRDAGSLDVSWLSNRAQHRTMFVMALSGRPPARITIGMYSKLCARDQGLIEILGLTGFKWRRRVAGLRLLSTIEESLPDIECGS
jgi:hypothetical protein